MRRSINRQKVVHKRNTVVKTIDPGRKHMIFGRGRTCERTRVLLVSNLSTSYTKEERAAEHNPRCWCRLRWCLLGTHAHGTRPPCLSVAVDWRMTLIQALLSFPGRLRHVCEYDCFVGSIKS
jgi:hypothetical protein